MTIDDIRTLRRFIDTYQVKMKRICMIVTPVSTSAIKVAEKEIHDALRELDTSFKEIISTIDGKLLTNNSAKDFYTEIIRYSKDVEEKIIDVSQEVFSAVEQEDKLPF